MSGGYLYGWDNVNSKWVKVVCDANGKLKIDPALILENLPTEDETKKGATSEWLYDHWKNAAAHHAKYTDLEAQTACNLNGNLYWSCAGIHFDAQYPDVADVTKSDNGVITANADTIRFHASVSLPNGATVTGAIIHGNAGSAAETWTLIRVKLSDLTTAELGSANINTEDTSIANAVIDTSLYSYSIYTSSLDINDAIYGARINYTL